MAKVIKTIAYVDGVASLSEEVSDNIGTEASCGEATDASRHDHVHILGSGVVDGTSIELNSNALRVVADGITAAQIHDDAIGSEHIETLSAALNAGKNQFQNMLLHCLASDPTTPAAGQWWYRTDLTEVRVCISAS